MQSIERKTYVAEKFTERFAAAPELWSRAPGRVDLMGSHTDYNHGHVLTLSIGRETWLAARPRPDQCVACFSTTTGDGATFCLDVITRDRDVLPEDVAGFLSLRSPRAEAVSRALHARGVMTDYRADILRLGPAPYLSDAQLHAAMDRLGEVLRALS